jgi:hypothetical protein
VQGGGLAADRLGQYGEVDRHPVQAHAAVGPGQGQQVLDEPAHAYRLAGDVAQRSVAIGLLC